MSKVLVTEVSVSSFGKLVGTVNGVIGLVIGTIGAVVATIALISNYDYSFLSDILLTFAIMLTGIVIYPLIAFLFGWLYGAVIALIFNLVIGISGGLQITTEDLKTTK